jgi:hypothetical protein
MSLNCDFSRAGGAGPNQPINPIGVPQVTGRRKRAATTPAQKQYHAESNSLASRAILSVAWCVSRPPYCTNVVILCAGSV